MAPGSVPVTIPLSWTGLPMSRRRARIWRVARVRYRRLLRRLERETPEWMRWLTPWGSSLALHAALLLMLGVVVYTRGSGFWDRMGRAKPDRDIIGQLRDDLTALRASD